MQLVDLVAKTGVCGGPRHREAGVAPGTSTGSTLGAPQYHVKRRLRHLERQKGRLPGLEAGPTGGLQVEKHDLEGIFVTGDPFSTPNRRFGLNN